MNDLDTFEQRLVRDMHDATGEIRPDLDSARIGVSQRLDNQPNGSHRSGRGMFLAVAAGITLVVGAGTFALSQTGSASEDTASDSIPPASALDESATEADDAVESEEAASADETLADPVEDADDVLPDGLDWDTVAAPTLVPADGNATQVQIVTSDPAETGPDNPGTVTAYTDDGRSLDVGPEGQLTEASSAAEPALIALAVNRTLSADDAAAAALRAIGTDPDRATSTTIDTRLWFIAVDAFETASLDENSWGDVLRLATSIDGVRVNEELTSDGDRLIDVTFYEAPGGGTWSLEIDGNTGWPIQSIRIDRDGQETSRTDYTVARVEIEEPKQVPPFALSGDDAPIVVGPLGIELHSPTPDSGPDLDSNAVLTAFWGTDEDELIPALEAILGEGADTSQSCPANPVLDARQWPGLSLFFISGKLVGWFVDGDVDPGVAITSSNGISIGSSIADLQNIDPGAVLDPNGPLGPEFFDGAVSFFATDASGDAIVSDMQSGQTCVAR